MIQTLTGPPAGGRCQVLSPLDLSAFDEGEPDTVINEIVNESYGLTEEEKVRIEGIILILKSTNRTHHTGEIFIVFKLIAIGEILYPGFIAA